MMTPKLTTKAACRVARIDRDRFNEHVAAGHFGCAPNTTPGRARLFNPDDMIALYLFRELMDDGLNARRADRIACAVSQAARLNPEAKSITYVQDYFSPDSGTAFPASAVPEPETWDTTLLSGTDIRKTTTFNILKMRALIAHYTEEERAVIGEDDEPSNAAAIKDLNSRYTNGLITSHEFAEEMVKLTGSHSGGE